MLSLSTRFNVIRALVGQKEPVILEAVVRNDGGETVLASVLVKLPFDLGFDRTGLMREDRRRVGYIGAGATKVVPFRIYPKSTAAAGTYPIEVRALTHTDRWDRTIEEKADVANLRIITR